MEYFADKDSVVRQIWGKTDTVLLIFAGASAEFALNKAVDWLYFTGKLPLDPLGRLFSTVSYAQGIVFSEKAAAHRIIDHITAIHTSVEGQRGEKIPDWAYRDVLFMLIDYSIRSFEILERKLSATEKENVFLTFNQLGIRMGLTGLPKTFTEWQTMRNEHLNKNLVRGKYTDDLFSQYRKHLGLVRYRILLETQALVAPGIVRDWLGLRGVSHLGPLLALYKASIYLKLDGFIKSILLPAKFKKEILALESAQDLTKTNSAPINRPAYELKKGVVIGQS
jgi:hypothetical protein